MISPKWQALSYALFRNYKGLHCHWCKYIESEDGESHCTNEKSEFCDGDRIRTWDGEECVEKCGQFELDEWYTNDQNYTEMMIE